MLKLIFYSSASPMFCTGVTIQSNCLHKASGYLTIALPTWRSTHWTTFITESSYLKLLWNALNNSVVLVLDGWTAKVARELFLYIYRPIFSFIISLYSKYFNLYFKLIDSLNKYSSINLLMSCKSLAKSNPVLAGSLKIY